MEDLRTAAFLHDIGHMTLTTDADHFEAPGHAEEGERLVRAAQFPEVVAAAVRNHHARYDGGGVPDALTGDKIPIASRIIAVAEAYEAITAGRASERLAPPSALKLVASRTGTEFDPAIVEALGRSVRDGNMEPALPSVALPAIAS
jgi:HD-GYP domain-containing protein (c-di-GMP phosphodiesterase class II)